MKKLVLLALSTSATLLLAAACIDDDDGRQACEALASLCLPVTGTAKCDSKGINESPNGSVVEDCIQAAPDCDAATACLATLEPVPAR